jgi:hypothetical protein
LQAKYIKEKLSMIVVEKEVNKVSEVKVNRKCCADNCKGFLVNGICPICNNRSCKKCMTVKQKTHICRQEDIDTATLLMTNTKNCPKCNFGIYKISGCNVMFCTQCNTSFNWLTMAIISSRQVHNPHYFEWLFSRQNNNHNEEVVNCELDVDQIMWLSRRHPVAGGIAQKIQHMTHDIQTYGRRDIVSCSIQYIHNIITTEEFVKNIQANDKFNRLSEERRNLLEMYSQIGNEILVKMFRKFSDNLVKEYNELANYCQEKYDEINKSYGSKQTCGFSI